MNFSSIFRRRTAFLFLFLIVQQALLPTAAMALTGGPSQPEFASFSPAGMSEMVDAFSGDFSYDIPLFDIGGYPMNLSYKSGSNYEDEASWVGLGWTLNPGAINRNTRGIPDDFNGDIVTTETHRKDQIGFTGTLGFGAEFVGLKVGSLVSQSLTIGLSFDNYKGLGVVGGQSLGFRGPGNTKFSAGITSNSLSGISFETGISRGLHGFDDQNNSLKLTGSYNSRAGLQYIGYELKKRISIERSSETNEKSDMSSMVLDMRKGISGGFSYEPISFGRSSYNIKSTSCNLNFSLGFTAATFDGRISVNGSYSVNKLAENIRNQPSYGFLNSKIGKDIGNQNAIYDYSLHYDGMVLPERPDVPYSTGNYDVFYISGQGIGGQFQAETRSSGQILNNHTESISNSISGGVQISPGGETYWGADLKDGSGISTTGDFHVSSDISCLFKHNVNLSNSISEEVKWNLNTDLQVDEEEMFENYGNQSPVTFTWSGAGRDIEPNIAMKTRTAIANNNKPYQPNNGLLPALGMPSRAPRKNVLSSLTAIEAASIGFDKIIRNYKKGVSPHLIIQSTNPIVCTNLNRTTITKPHHLSEFKVVQSSGMRYIYGLPISSGSQTDITMSVEAQVSGSNAVSPLIEYGASENSSGNNKGIDHFYQKKTTPASVNSFLLTSVQSPDYVDKTNNGLSPDDLGQAIKFNYTLLTNNYKWRNPVAANKAALHIGDRTNPQDDKASFSYGAKSVWYLHSMESNDFIAVFHTSDRDDCLQISPSGDKLSLDKRMQKLDKISIYSKASLLLDSTYAQPIKEIHFSYSYEMGTVLPNCIDGKGKLTLKKIWTTYSDNDTQFSVYTFSYNLPTEDYQTDLTDRWGSYARHPLGIDRSDFPYTMQDKSIVDSDATIFNLKEIVQPTGATIEVFYESDDYQYVQDKRASAMYKIVDFIKNLSTDQEVLSPGSDANVMSSDDDFIVVKLLKDVPVAEAALPSFKIKDYFPDYDLNLPLYFSVNCHMKNDKIENLEGYIDLDQTIQPKLLKAEISSQVYKYLAFKIKHIEETSEEVANTHKYHPISFIGYQKMRLSLPHLLYPTPQYLGSSDDQGAITNFMTSVIRSTLQDMSKIVLGFAKTCKILKYCSKVDLDKSFVRLGVPKAKFGGGSRVKKVVMTDNWIQGQVQDNDGVLTRNYYYTLEDGTSSGVAIWEPVLGRDENSHVSVMPYTQAVKMAPDNTFYSEKPYCESLMPSASVGYSRVVVVDTDIDQNSNGWQENTFYTAKDFPTEVFATQPEKQHYWPKILNWIPVYGQNINHLNLSQGFTVINNAFHGKPKFQATYKGEFDVDTNVGNSIIVLQSKEYEYSISNVSIPGLSKYYNNVPMLKKNLEVENMSISKKMYLWQNFYTDVSSHESLGLEANLDVFIYLLGFPLPLPWPSWQFTDHRLRLSSTVKQFEVTPILNAITVNDKGSTLRTENVLWDPETGDVLMTRTQNEFNNSKKSNNNLNWIYHLALPAHYVYDMMGGGYHNIGYSETINQDAYGRFASQFFMPGDEVSILNNLNEAVSEILTVVAFDDGGQNRLALMDVNGKVYKTDHSFSAKVIHSGYKNLLNEKVYQLTFEKNPIQNGVLKLEQASQILDANAITYSDQWQIFKSIRTDSCAAVVHNIDSLAIENNSMAESFINGLFELADDGYLHSNALSTILEAGGFLVDSNSIWFDGNLVNSLNFVPLNTTTPLGEMAYFEAIIGNCLLKLDNKNPFNLQDLYFDQSLGIVGPEFYNDSSGLARKDYSLKMYCTDCMSDCIIADGLDINPYKQGMLGNWRPLNTWAMNTTRSSSFANAIGTRINTDGNYTTFTSFWEVVNNRLQQTSSPSWFTAAQVTKYDPRGHALESKDALGVYSAEKYGFNNNFVIAAGKNVSYESFLFESFEDRPLFEGLKAAKMNPRCVERFTSDALVSVYKKSHTGHHSVQVPKTNVSGQDKKGVLGIEFSVSSTPSGYFSQHLNTVFPSIKPNQSAILQDFKPVAGNYVISAWFKDEIDGNRTKDQGGILVYEGGTTNLLAELKPTGERIEGWRRISGVVSLVAGKTYSIHFLNQYQENRMLLFDDFKIQPLGSSVQGFVYDLKKTRLMATLDDNNFASIYEYDDKGALIRVKQETERGIQTIQEGRQHIRVQD